MESGYGGFGSNLLDDHLSLYDDMQQYRKLLKSLVYRNNNGVLTQKSHELRL